MMCLHQAPATGVFEDLSMRKMPGNWRLAAAPGQFLMERKMLLEIEKRVE